MLFCAEQQSESELNLSHIYSNSDTTTFALRVEDSHAEVRSVLNKSLKDYLKSRGAEDTISVSDPDELSWLVGQYSDLSGVTDISRMFAIYSAWSNDEVHQRLALDSAFGIQYRIRDLHKKITALHETRRHYSGIGDTFRVAGILYAVATVYYAKGIVDSTALYALECVDVCSNLDYRKFNGWSCYLLGRVYGSYRGDYLSAEEQFARGAELFASIGSTLGLAEIRLNRADQRAARYETELAEQGFHQALSDFRYLGNQPKEGYCLYALAETFYDKDQLDSAKYYAELSLEVRHQLHKRYASEVGNSLSALGLISAARNNPSDAKRYYLQADSVFQNTVDTTGLCLNAVRVGDLLLNDGDADKARERFLFVSENSDRFEETISSLYGLAVCDYLQNDFESALPKLTLCIKHHESSSMRLPVPEAKTGLLSDRIGFYNLTAAIFAQMYSKTKKQPCLDSVFHYMERSKAQTLRDMIADTPSPEYSHLVEPILDSIARLDNSLILGNKDSVNILSELYKMEDSLQRVRFKLKCEQSIPDLDSLFDVVDLNAVQKNMLKPGDLVLEYLVSEFGCYLFAITTDDIILREIDISREQLDTFVNEILDNIAHYPTVITPSTEYADLCRELSRLLIPADLRSPEQTKRIILIPDGPLFRMPFDALISDDGRYLIENYDISYTSSMTVLNAVLSRRIGSPNDNDIVIFADPTIDSTIIASLPNSRNEVNLIQNAFDADRVKSYTAKEATKSSFKSHDYSSTRYLHISTHGLTNKRHAERSALIFSGESGSGSSLLQASEIAAMNIPVDMVVLSACGTASGISLPGEGVMNLAKPFFVAGARSVVATDWNVDDRGATLFVKNFYSQLAKDSHKLHSFSKTKRDFIHSEIPLYRHPYFWASWRLIGACQ